MEAAMKEMGMKVKRGSRSLAISSTEEKNKALATIADSIEARADEIEQENSKDLEAGRANGLTDAMIDRLRLDAKAIKAMADGVRDIIKLPDPVGRVYDETVRPNGLKLHKVRIPLGVVGIIYESRPNVTVDATVLCIKSGNGVVLRGGSEAFYSNRCLASIISHAIKDAGFDGDCVQFINTTDRGAVLAMLKMDEYIDVIIPRGGNGLIRFVSENSSIPVIKHDAGLCAIYLDATADMEMAKQVILNSKTERTGVCNAAEKLLVNRAALQSLPKILDALKAEGVEVRGDEDVCKVWADAKPATEQDYLTEFLSLTISVKVVGSMQDAIEHIEETGSHHTDVILTDSKKNADYFLRAVDSSAVMVNASTRFNDGGQFGLGAEMGISTQKLHVRGPMGLEELTTYKYIAIGEGQVR